MHIPALQTVLTAGAALSGSMMKSSTVIKGKVTDYAVETCIDSAGEVRCTKPFLAVKGNCYNIEWSTEGTFSHTTCEVRDAGSNDIVYYRDTNGDWTAEKGELVYLDFKPKVPNTGNDTVTYKVKNCNKD